MSESINITSLSINEWKSYRDLRLEALKDSPTAFGSSYEDEIKTSDETWEERLHNSLNGGSCQMFFAKAGDSPIGMIMVCTESASKVRHIANIYGVYVTQRFRSQGVGLMLMEHAMNWIKNNPQISKIKLSVVTENSKALNLYKKLGFTVVGKFEKELFVNGQYYDEHLMEMFVK